MRTPTISAGRTTFRESTVSPSVPYSSVPPSWGRSPWVSSAPWLPPIPSSRRHGGGSGPTRPSRARARPPRCIELPRVSHRLVRRSESQCGRSPPCHGDAGPCWRRVAGCLGRSSYHPRGSPLLSRLAGATDGREHVGVGLCRSNAPYYGGSGRCVRGASARRCGSLRGKRGVRKGRGPWHSEMPPSAGSEGMHDVTGSEGL